MNFLKTLFIFLVGFNSVTAQTIITEEINLKNGEIMLSGTLSYLKTNNPLPLIIFVPGSGNVDRNGNQLGGAQANYIKQLSDTLVSNNIAFYRYDKRSSNPENIKYILKSIVFEDLVADVKLIIKHFKKDERFRKIIIAGHSQGSLVGMLALNNEVDAFISIAGAGRTFEDLLYKQISVQNEDLAKTAKAHLKELNETDTILKVNPLLTPIFSPVNYDFIKTYNRYNPAEVIKKVNIPALILNGDSDLQINENDAQALYKGKPDAVFSIIKKMNHVLKEVNSLQENGASYRSPDFPLSKELISSLIAFTKQ